MKTTEKIGDKLLRIFRTEGDNTTIQICHRSDGKWQIDLVSNDRAVGIQKIDESLARALAAAERDWR